MVKFILLIFLFTTACTGPADKQKPTPPNNAHAQKVADPSQTVWTGKINNTIPVRLVYTVHETLITGAITYLNTKNKSPLKVIGTIEEDGSIRLCEFEPDGNITGIITGTPAKPSLMVNGFHPKQEKNTPCT